MDLPQTATIEVLVARELSALGGRWKVPWRGDGVRGPGNLGVTVAESTCGPNCLEFGFLWDRKDPNAPVTWDHVGCFGQSEAERAASAVHMWSQTTACALLEVLARDGRYGGHLRSGDPDGVPGWHAVHGPWLGWGVHDEGLDALELQAWALGNPPLPILADAIVSEIDRPGPVGVKLFLAATGTEAVAEVRVDGAVSEPASELLLGLDWPRIGHQACLRSFVVLVHEE